MGRRERNKKKQFKTKIIKRVSIAFAILTVIFIFTAFSLLADAVKLVPKLENPKESRVDQTTKIYTANNKLIANLHAEQHRIVVPLDKIPKRLQEAIVAIEDRRFYQHNGVDIEAIGRALVENMRSGKIVEGGSTITQQYVKNVFISNERTLNRKLKEAVLAYELEKRFSKKKILEKYLNTVYFGHGNYGVEAASEAFFGKKIYQLNLQECAMLAGLIRSPQSYSPWNHIDKANVRKNLVLSKMAEAKYISDVQSIKAKAVKIKIQGPKINQKYPAPYFIEYVRQQVLSDKRFGETEQERANTLYKGGLRIYTTINLKTQEQADNAVRSILDRKGDPSGALVAINPKTGHVNAISGGRDFFNDKEKFSKFNLAVQAKRQTGSAFKVFVLVAAMSQGMTPNERIESKPATLSLPGGGVWKVDNYTEGKGYGRITIREGTIKSINGLYARLMLEVGVKKVISIAHRMGIVSKLEPYPAIALGGLKYGVNVLEMTSAMATLANNGNYIKPITITKVTDAQGRILVRNEPKGKQVISPNVTSTVTAILQDVIKRGTGTRANIGRPAAGKTGTAQNYRDAWFVGYTPDLAASVWVGHPEGQIPMTSVHGTRVSGGSFPSMIWRAFMKEALADVPPSKFPYSKYNYKDVPLDPCKDEDGKTRKTYNEDCATIKVPSVIGLTASSAVKKLNKEGFAVNKVYKESSSRLNTVFKQSPSGGAKAKSGSSVTIYISKGAAPKKEEPKTTTVPSVVGLSEADALASLSSAGFTGSVTRQASDPDKVGLVISQSPEGGSKANNGTSISIIVGQ